MLLVQLANVLSTEGLFYACIIPFVAFFGSFAFILYPLRDVIHPTGTTSASAMSYPITLLLGWSLGGIKAGSSRILKRFYVIPTSICQLVQRLQIL